MSDTRELTALDVLAVAAGEAPVGELIDFLKNHDIKDEPVETECWQVVCDVQSLQEPVATVAARHRIAVIESMPRTVADPAQLDISGMITLVQTYSIKCAYSSYADSYVAAMLKAMLPPEEAALVPRDLPPYPHAAKHFHAECNEVMRPILKTPLRSVLSNATWDDKDMQGFFAVAITLRELTGGMPRVYVNTDLAAATAEPAVFALCHSICGGGCGVTAHGKLTFYANPLHALIAWIDLVKGDPRVKETAEKILP